ncbi:hypothetical protein AJ78_04081 [Emergomyces pasteurianus Ep9510]|uniref:Uncharacterized protein n=1 Tax=Emergomyces pasteurianus Ep9510 TaxID=1447872 RepID=A0A1J9QHP5_9EURO|nr:hypothetical protein AJ78_04081 [Emergomyces pasteurianus Ep9510]
MRRVIGLFLLLSTIVSANVEKTIFTAPKPSPLLSHRPMFDDLEIERLSPQSPSTRTYIISAFPSEAAPRGFESWYYLDSLKPGQRYEVRVCYLATQPTYFTLKTHTVSDILDSPSLISSLTTFATSHLPTLLDQLHHDHEQTHYPHNADYERKSNSVFATPPKLGRSAERDAANQASTSALFLQVHAAAEYFTLDKGLMENVPPVYADIILDPYVFNVFPKSLLPTAVYILILAGVAWVMSWFVWTGIEGVVGVSKKKKRDRGSERGRDEGRAKKDT